MNSYYAYIRVSTVKQGEHGSSLQEQRAAIEAFAARKGLGISEWFEETETAAKLGRRQFNKMISALERGRAAGVIIHKIDRSARNLKDWAHLGELMDRGIEVHFAHDSLDLTTRGGRLAADLQAVVAADYIRNLREEVRKGFLGRLKQGIYPLPAPRGYRDQGAGKPKTIDPIEGQLVLEAFAQYASGNHGLHTLRFAMFDRGLRSKSGQPLSLDAMSYLLRNPFYIGLIRIKRTGETYEGIHEPLVPKAVFDRVQAILSGRQYPRFQKNRFLFRRLINCGQCGRALSGERQKGNVYYRCHSFGCPGVSLREEKIDALVRAELEFLVLDDGDLGDFREVVEQELARERGQAAEEVERVSRDLVQIDQRLERLLDAVLDGTIDKATYDQRKATLIRQKLDKQERGAPGTSTKWQSIAERFERGFVALRGYELGDDEEKRDILKSVSSNLMTEGKEPVLPMVFPFRELREWRISSYGAPHHGALRTLFEIVRGTMESPEAPGMPSTVACDSA